jgi:hypothetical protein
MNSSRLFPSSAKTALSYVVGGLLWIWASYLFANLRTMDFGLSAFEALASAVAACLVVVPLGLLAFAGMAWRLRLLTLGAVCLTAWLTAEVFASAQEHKVVSQFGSDPGKPVVIKRWWPFEHHDIIFEPPFGWSGTD